MSSRECRESLSNLVDKGDFAERVCVLENLRVSIDEVWVFSRIVEDSVRIIERVDVLLILFDGGFDIEFLSMG